MAIFVVLEDFSNGRVFFTAGSTLDDATIDLAPLRASGLCDTPFVPGMEDVIDRFLGIRASGFPSRENDLPTLLQRSIYGASAVNTLTGQSVETRLAGGGGTLAGDVTGPSGSNTVSLLQTVPLNLAGILAGNVLQFNGTSIVPAPGGGLGPFGEFIYVDVLLGNDGTGARGNDNLPFATINAALAVYQNGDVIQLGAGEFLGTVDLDLATLATAVVIRGIKGTTRIYQNTPASTMTSTLKNLIALFDVTVDNNNGYAIEFTGATNPDILLSGVSVQPQGGLGVRVDDANRLDIRSGSRIEDPLVISNTLQPFHATTLSEGSTLSPVSITSTINSNIVLQSGSSILNALTTNGTSINVFEGCFVESITAFLSNNSVSMGGRIGTALDLTCDTNGAFNPVILAVICSATSISATGPSQQNVACFGAGFGSIFLGGDTTIDLTGALYDEKLVNLSTATSRIIRGSQGRLASYQDTNSGLFIQAVPIYTTPYDAVFTLKATVNAYAVSAVLSGSFIIEARYRIVGGAMSIIGTPTSSYDGDVVTWICIATTNGLNIEISTVGDGVNTVKFEMHTQIFENEFI